MTLTAMGNSLTAGNLGIPYLSYLDLSEGYRVINRGRDGDTVAGIRERLDDALREDQPGIVLVQTGANDILIPEVITRGEAWRAFARGLIDGGAVPAENEASFTTQFAALLARLAIGNVPRVVVTTIPPLGEDRNTPRNRKRAAYNERIREVAREAAVDLADVADAFDHVLDGIPHPSDWFFEDLDHFVADKRRIRKEGSAVPLSEERGLFLTMDGAHLNERGAQLMAETIRPYLL